MNRPKIFTNIKHISERVPEKNFRLLGGVPLYKRMLYRFKDYDFYIDTDSERILQEVAADPELSHVTAYMRTKEDAEAVNPGINMTYRFLEEHVQDEHEPVTVLHVTSPFLKESTVRDALNRFVTEGYDSVASVDVIRNFCLRKSYHDGKEVKYIPLNFDFRHIPRTQDLEPLYVLNHAFYMFTKHSIKKHDNRIGNNPLFYEIDHPENFEIDWEPQWKMAEYIVSSKKDF